MMYILTQEEYDRLRGARDMMDKAVTAELQRLCTLAAQHVPVYRSWNTDDMSPWGCILAPEYKDPSYCDCCPVNQICPSDRKRFSQ